MFTTSYRIRGENITAGYPIFINCDAFEQFMNNAGYQDIVLSRFFGKSLGVSAGRFGEDVKRAFGFDYFEGILEGVIDDIAPLVEFRQHL